MCIFLEECPFKADYQPVAMAANRMDLFIVARDSTSET